MSQAKRSRRRRAGTVDASSRVPNKDQLVGLLEWFLADAGIFSKVKLHGNTSWLPKNLVWLALCWAWSESKNLTPKNQAGHRLSDQSSAPQASTKTNKAVAIIGAVSHVFSFSPY
jgi:hypothetical protein